MGIKQLKEFISARGGDFSDCVEKADLKKRAHEVAAKKPVNVTTVAATPGTTKVATPPRAPAAPASIASPAKGSVPDDELVDEDADIPDSDDDDAGTEEVVKGKTQKRFSVFRVKKFMTAQIGKTSAGQATVMKVLGEDGHVVVQALKSVTTKIKDAKVAKENKKDGIRFCLKAYNLWKHKDFTVESTKGLQHDAQLLAEIFCREAQVVVSGKRADIAPLVRCALRIHEGAMHLMSPHIQPKNAARLSELLKFYASSEFFEALLNDKENEAEREAIEKSATTMLLPLAPLLSGERERTSLARAQTLLRALENKRFEIVIDNPTVTHLFQQYLDLELGLASKNGLRFLLAVRDFEKTASRDLMKLRAPKIVDRFLSPNSELRVDGIDPKLVQESLDCIADGNVGMSTFAKVSEAVRRTLEDDFMNQFTGSKDYSVSAMSFETSTAPVTNQLTIALSSL